MIELLTPTGLAALAALILPVLIHLVRRSERRLVDFAALRWLSERTRPRQRIRLHERLLLLLRLLLIAVLALLLALPVLREAGEGPAAVFAVAPGIDPAVARAAAADAAADGRWLAPGFPGVDAPAPPALEGQAFASLIRELDAQLPATTALTIIVPPQLAGLDAGRLQLSRDVRWQIVRGGQPAGPAAPAPRPLKLSLRVDEAGAAEVAVVRALATAWRLAGQDTLLEVAPAPTPIPADADLVFWLAGAPTAELRAWIDAGGTVVVTRSPDAEGRARLVDESAAGAVLLREQRLGRGRLLSLPHALTLAAMPQLQDAAFPERLRRLLLPMPAAPDRAFAEAYAPSVSGTPNAGVATPLIPWLALLAALIFLVERWLASGPRRVAE